MSLFARLFARQPDPREALRPLWHRLVGIAREPGWYATGKVADTVEGRFDMITLVLAVAMLRLERAPELVPATARLTELFVDDMDAQLREEGIGDPTLGKKMGQLMEALGGRIGALRTAFAATGDAALADAVARNASFAGGGDPAWVASELRAFAAQLAAIPDDSVLAGEIAR